jgi:hypothetical protein
MKEKSCSLGSHNEHNVYFYVLNRSVKFIKLHYDEILQHKQKGSHV